MGTAIEPEIVESEDAAGALPVIKYNVTDQKLAEIEEKYMPLVINGVDDRDGYKVVHDARMDVKRLRVEVDKRRKALGEDARRYLDDVNSEAKRIIGRLTPVEEHLKSQEDAIAAEKERLKAEAEAAARKLLEDRLEQLRQVEATLHPMVVEQWSDEEFATELQKATEAFAEKRRIAAEAEAARKAEEDRLAKEREELERLKAEAEAKAAEERRLEAEKLAAERAELEKLKAEQEAAAQAERDRLAEEQRKQQEAQAAIDAEKRKLDEERIAREAAEKAKLEEQERVAWEKAEAEERATREAEAAALVEAQRPDREKLLAVAEAVGEIGVPAVSEDLIGLRQMVVDILNNAQQAIRNVVIE